MKTKILFSSVLLLAGSLIAADSTPKDEVLNAAKALAGKASYSWHQTITVPEGSQFRPGPTDGKTEKDGFTQVTTTFGGNTADIFLKGDKAAANIPDTGWQSLAELEADQQGPGRFMVTMLRTFKAPAALVSDILTNTATIKKDGDTYSSDLNEPGARTMLSVGRRGGGGGGGNPPTISDAKGTVKFWIKDGVLAKYETHVTGKRNDQDVDRTTTVEIKDIGTTKVTVPEEAKKKLNP